MKCMITTLAALALTAALSAQEARLRPEVFGLLDLERPGLEDVKAQHEAGNEAGAAAALLDYYKNRQGICTPEIPDINKIKLTKEQQQWADDALNHTFFVHQGYQPSYNYGEDINWRYWPVEDNELRWQLHRHKWFTPMGRAYRVSGDEKYAIEWTKQYIDWIRKNPCVKISKAEYEITDDSQLKEDAENTRYAWRPLEVSHRLQDQTLQFQLFIDSPAFTAEFLTEFLVNYHKHAEHIMKNYSDKGNHLLFEAQRMLYAGTFFPEFSKAETWRESGVDILNKEINVQVYDDGAQYELCPHYHLAAINIFIKALEVADVNGFRDAFPKSYIDTIEKMIEFYINISFPDYTNPCFSDAKLVTRKEMLKNLKSWSRIFPENGLIRYWASEGAEGEVPDYLSKGFLTSGFFVFRNSWTPDAVQMVVKAGPPAFWHNQPDNGTFELWYNGKNLFPDSGSYVYAGNGEIMEERNWFRQSAVHNTLTLGHRNFETTDSKTLLWQPEGDVQILVTENQSYSNLKHRRSIFFVGGNCFVIVDEAVGNAKGYVNLHYQMPRSGKFPIENTSDEMYFATTFEDGSNFRLECFGPEGMTKKKEEGWQSPAYKKKYKRMNVSYNVRKEAGEPVRYITVIALKKDGGNNPKMSAKFLNKTFDEGGLKLQVKCGKDKRTLEYNL